MDTRTKIVPAAEAARIAAARRDWSLRGYFDPLLASHAERLAGLKRAGLPLMVLDCRAGESDPAGAGQGGAGGRIGGGGLRGGIGRAV